MPRPRNHHGRPGTRVFSDRWDEHHAPIIDRTRSGRCQITSPGKAEFDPDLGYTPEAEPIVHYDGPYRLQELSQAARVERIGGQAAALTSYLLVIGRPAVGVRRRAEVRFLNVNAAGEPVPMDPDLAERAFFVATVTRGSHRWERDLTIVDDLSLVPAEGGDDDES